MASPPSSPVFLPPPPPPPSAYIQSWLAKGSGPGGDKVASAPAPTVGSLEAELASLGDPSAAKTAAKDLLQRVLPRLAAHDVPTPASLKTLSGMLVEGASAERFVVRYAHYFTQRLLERYGCAAFTAGVPEGRGLIDRLSEDLSRAHAKHSARTVLAARALVAGAKSGIPEARTAATAALGPAAAALAAGNQPRDGAKRSKSIFGSSTDEGVDTGARVALGASLRLGDARAAAQGARGLLSPEAIAAGVRSEDAVAARHAWAGALALAAEQAHSPPKTSNAPAPAPAAHARVAHALCAAATELAGVMEARRHASSVTATAPEEKSRAAAVKAARAAEKDAAAKFRSAPRLASTATAALAMRACGALAARLAADAADPGVPESERARAGEGARTLRGVIRAALCVADAAARAAAVARSAARPGAPAPAPPQVSVFSTARVALASVAGAFAGDAPADAHGARARAAAWDAAASSGRHRDALDVLVASARVVTSAVLLGLEADCPGAAREAARRHAATRSAACRAAAAMGEAMCASLAASGASTASINGATEADAALAALEYAVWRVAELETVPSGVRVEALLAALWLQTPARDVGAGDRMRLLLATGAGRGDATEAFDSFESYEAHVRREGEGISVSSSVVCVSDTWRGCDVQRHLLDALARRSATIAAMGSARQPRPTEARTAWTRATLDSIRSVVDGGPRSADPAAVVDALLATQRASLPGRSRERVLETTAALLRAARGADAPELAAALTWHLGENANFTCGVYAWAAEESGAASARVHPGVDAGRLGLGGEDASAGNDVFEGAAATAAGRAPVLAAAAASLARSALTSPWWMTRAAAVSALATVALRSGEPFRLQCYAALRAARAASTRGSSGYDVCASALERHIATLDHVYRGGARFRALRARHGDDMTRWPEASLAEVAGRHDVLFALASSTCFLPAHSYAPMGGDSRAFADAFAGDRALAARTAAELMAGEADAARRKAGAGRRRDGMTSSVVAARPFGADPGPERVGSFAGFDGDGGAGVASDPFAAAAAEENATRARRWTSSVPFGIK